jgi:AI-2 transport protein TqsA
MAPESTPTPNPAIRWGVSLVVLFALSLALYFGQSLFIPTVVGLLLACMLWPIVGWLARGGVPWGLAATVIVGLVFVLLLTSAYAGSRTLPGIIEALPTTPQRQQDAYTHFRVRITGIMPWAIDENFLPENAEDSQLVKYLHTTVDPKNPQIIDNTLLGAGALGYWILQTTLVLFILFFFLLEGRLLTSRLVDVVSSEGDARAEAVTALADIAAQVRSFLIWRTTINVGAAAVFGVIYQLCGLSHPWTWALLTIILLYVPYLGTFLASIPPLLDAFINVDSPWVTIGLLVFYVAFVTVEGYIIVPLVMGRSMDLNATTVLLTTVYWHLVWGTAGLFLSMPLMAMVKAVCAHVPGWKPWARLMETEAQEKHPEGLRNEAGIK